MENRYDAEELLDLIIEEASTDQDSSISTGLTRVLKRVRARLEPESEPT